jgi:hypothetical protein
MKKAIQAVAVWVCVMIGCSAVKTTRSPRTRALYAGLRPRHVGWGAISGRLAQASRRSEQVARSAAVAPLLSLLLVLSPKG